MVERRILEVDHEQERTFCRFGRRYFASRRNYRESSRICRYAPYRRRHLGADKRSQSSVGGSSPGRRAGCTVISPPSEISPAKPAESSFLFMIDLQNSPLNHI